MFADVLLVLFLLLTAPAAVASIDMDIDPYQLALGINPQGTYDFVDSVMAKLKGTYKIYRIKEIKGCYLMEGNL